METYQLNENVNLTIVPTDKFKDNVISLRFLLDLDAKKSCARSLLAFMLTNRTKRHPTNQQLTSYLDDLYGMGISMNTYSIGACHLLELRCNALADRYAKADFSLLKKQADLLKEVLYEPLLDENGLIDKELLEEAKMIMESRILRRQDDPVSYAMDENSKRIGKGTPFAISCLGELEDLAQLTREDVKQAYEDLLYHSIIDIYVVGTVDPSQVRNLLEKTLSFHGRNVSYPLFYKWPIHQPMDPIEIQRDIDQSSLVVTWLTNINLCHPLFYALKVANGVLGGDASSLFFNVIREKHSLCYTIYSSVYGMDAVMLGYAGISYENKDKTLALMKEQFEAVKSGKFSETDMETSKRLMINGLRSQFDSAGGIVNFLYQQKVSGLQLALEDVIERIKQVTMQDVIASMQEVELIGTFVLKERDGEHDETDSQ